MKNRAFTLVELLVTIGIISIIMAIVFANLSAGQNRFALKRSANKLAQDIRRVQEMAMASREQIGAPASFKGAYGIYLERNTANYIIFADLDNDQAYDVGEKVEGLSLERKMTVGTLIRETDCSLATLAVVFSPPDPTTNITERIQIIIKDTVNDVTKMVEVNRAGLIRIGDNPLGCL